MSRPTQVSMQDVAKAADVSPQTVSRVANGSDAVKPETRQRVEAAMERLGYRPNYAARALKHGRFQDIGVVMFNTATFGNARILDSIVANAADDDYSVTIQTMRHGAERTLSAAIDHMQRQPVDGVIVVLEERISDFVGYKPPREFPVVLICESAADHCPTVDADQYGCSTAIVDYLMSKGHKTVYHIAGPSTSRAAESRARGWREALEQMGARVPSMYIGDWCADSGYQAGVALAHDPDCTAIYAANDQMAYGAMLGLQSAGKRVPEDVSIVGVDDSLVDMVPRLNLTTMKLRFDDIGATAFSMVRRQCEGEKIPVGVKTVIPPELIERGSVLDIS